MAESKMPHYGGQALIEGVLMRGEELLGSLFPQPPGRNCL